MYKFEFTILKITDDNIKLPKQWVEMRPEEAVLVVQLEESKNEYKKLAEEFRGSVGTVVDILKVSWNHGNCPTYGNHNV